MSKIEKYRVGILSTHPVQYYAPLYKALARHPEIDLEVFYCHRQTPKGQALAGFGVEFDWDVPLLEGYKNRFLKNAARNPGVNKFFGCDTPEIGNIIGDNRFDAFIIDGWYVKSHWQAAEACRRSNTPLLVRGDSYLLSDSLFMKRAVKYGIYHIFMKNFKACLAPGKMAREYFLYYGADKDKIYFVPHAVDNEFFSSRCSVLMREREALRRTWAIPKDAIVFLFAGKLIPKKRPLDFIEALGAAHDANPEIFGLVTGDGPLKAPMENAAQEKKTAVTFTGFLNQSDMPKAYAVSDCLVLPSDVGETWGLVVNEAFACGLPAIVSDRVGCAPDLVMPGETGEVYRCADKGRLSDIIADLSLDRARLKKMGESAKKIIDKYSIDNAVKGIMEAVHNACS